MCSRCWCSRTHIRLKICNKVVWEWIFIGIEARRATMLHANTTSFPFRTSPIAFVRSVRCAYGMPFSALLLLFFFHNFSCSQSNRTCSVHGCHVTDHISYYDCESCTEIKTNLLSRKIQSDPCRIGKILWKKRKESAGGLLYTYGIENPFFFGNKLRAAYIVSVAAAATEYILTATSIRVFVSSIRYIRWSKHNSRSAKHSTTKKIYQKRIYKLFVVLLPGYCCFRFDESNLALRKFAVKLNTKTLILRSLFQLLL